MPASPLPDRERRHLLQFYIAPRLGYGVRLGWAGVLIFAGLALQLLWRSTSHVEVLLLSGPFLLGGSLFLLVRGYDLQPSHRLYGGAWEKTTRDRFHEARKLEDEVRSWDETFVDLTCTSGALTLLLLIGAVALIYWLLSQQAATRFWAIVFVVDAALLMLPHWITGTRRGWRPVALRQQVDALETALGAIERYEEPPCQLQPMFEMAGKGKNRTPIGARVLIRFPDAPEDFLGVQFQVALNDVQGTKYPYLYAVIIAKKPFTLLENHLEQVRRQADELTVETSQEDDVEVIVLRQHTTKTSGYHTDERAVRRIARTTWASVAGILGVATVA